MHLSDYAVHDATGLSQLIQAKQVSPSEVRAAAFQAIEAFNPQINALVETWNDEPAPHAGVFSGVPVLIKDLGITAKGRRNELGSALALGCTAEGDSQLMSRLRFAGLLPLGRTTTPEFAASTTTESRLHGPTRNPWDVTRSAGGSSGGAAAAVAAGMVPIAHATDGGGSIRVPASLCGLFGLKPSRGRVPMGPDVDEVWSGLAVHGVLTRSVRDSAALLDAVHGSAVGDPFHIPSPLTSFLEQSRREPHSLRIGVHTRPLNGQALHPAVKTALEQTMRHLEALGHQVEDVEPDIGVSWEAFVELNGRFWSSNTAAWIDAIAAATGRSINAEHLEPATLALYRYGKTLSATELLGALHERNIVARTLGGFFEDYDLLLSPTLPGLAPMIGQYNAQQAHLDGRGWMNHVFNQSPFTALANVTGAPAMSVPLSQDPKTGLPIGMQFMGKFGAEGVLLGLAGQLEREFAWADRRPGVWAGKL
ncbi:MULTISPECIES: amidase [unclassified Pseudomonas]|uniref:amidase n=1 Tax=unclassified Pseudomonas TaxID=196821 RepID=UPI000F584804|nr:MULTISPECIES: amidase [unclassified Pseudomonas]AZF50501.1 Amidase [Pseudomonas sp. R2-7-07]AZF61005.1 Amidase [Pseudomonas sp. R11-23-07]